MNQDLKIIKKKYGEKFMHLCRELFATILDNSPGILSKILLDNFEPSHFLYDDLIKEDCVVDFKNYLFSMYDLLNEQCVLEKYQVASPSELLRKVGYTLYECKTEEDIQKFRKYYAPREELCTFRGGRLKYCYVYFAVKDNADEIKRSDFPNPERQDEYGTSVISIQFTRDNSHTLSIKNRYNHTVDNPDATFSNNLNNIIPGLTKSFADHYGMINTNNNKYNFEIPGYVRANNGKFYKYNYEIDNVYYCPNNIIIDYFYVTQYDKERYLIADYFIIDLINKTISVRLCVDDCFHETFNKIKNIQIVKNGEEKIVTISQEIGEDVIIVLDKYNRIIRLKNNNLITIHDDFLSYNEVLQELTLDKVTSIGKYFLYVNGSLKKLSLPNVIKVGDSFLANSQLTEISLPKLEIIDDNFLEYNESLTEISLPSVIEIGNDFLEFNKKITKIDLPEVKSIGNGFLCYNKELKNINLPKVRTIGTCFCDSNKKISTINLPEVLHIGPRFLFENEYLTRLELPQVTSIDHMCLSSNTKITYINLPNIEQIGKNFLLINLNVHVFYAPNLQSSLYNEYLNQIWSRSSFKTRKLKK